MITADQLTLHMLGDYVLQSDWQANNKTKEHFPALCHALTYSLPFLILKPSLWAWVAIFVTHFFIDRYRLARYVVWAKNFLAAPTWWKLSRSTGEWSGASNQTRAMWLAWIDHGVPNPMPSDLSDILTMEKLRNLPFPYCRSTGYPPDRPAWLAVWLLILCDNFCHIAINGLALRFL